MFFNLSQLIYNNNFFFWALHAISRPGLLGVESHQGEHVGAVDTVAQSWGGGYMSYEEEDTFHEGEHVGAVDTVAQSGGGGYQKYIIRV